MNLKTAVKRAAVTADRMRPPPAGVVILCYHRVGAGTDLDIDLPVADFDAQLAVLAASGRVVTLDDAARALEQGAGDGAVVLTFDDGTADFADHVVPALVRHGLAATLYLATAFVAGAARLPARRGDRCRGPGSARRSATGLVTVGSHTHDARPARPRRPRAGSRRSSTDLWPSSASTSASTPRHFAYPKALRARAAVEAEVRQRFRSAALAGTRPNRYGAHRPAPPRPLAHPAQRRPCAGSTRKLAGGMGVEDALRRVVNRRRYPDVSTVSQQRSSTSARST